MPFELIAYVVFEDSELTQPVIQYGIQDTETGEIIDIYL